MDLDTLRLPPPILKYNNSLDRQTVFKIQDKYNNSYTNNLITKLKNIHLSGNINYSIDTNDLKYQKIKFFGENDFKDIN